jgi:hypothetical protein
MSEIRERLQTLESKLPKSLDAMAVSRIKLPWKPVLLGDVFSWRMADLARGAFENFEKDRLASAIVLTRAAVETCAALWHLCEKVSDAVDAKTVGDIDDYLMKLIMGSKTDSALPQALNVLKFVDHVNKAIEGFRHQYDLLSEYAHPNWAGTSLLFLKHNEETLVTDFGTNLRTENATKIGVLNLSVALMIFERSQVRLSDLIPDFTALCEANSSQVGR